MAVTIISVPASTGVYSVSYPVEATLSSDVIGGAGITLHKFSVAITINGTHVGTKYFTSISPPTATYDLSRILKIYVTLPLEADDEVGSPAPIPLIGSRFGAGGYGYMDQVDQISVETGESYLDNGNQVNTVGPTYTYQVVRGKSDSTLQYIWANRFEELGADTLRMPISGFDYFTMAFNVRNYLADISTSLYVVADFDFGNDPHQVILGTFPKAELIFTSVLYLPICPPDGTYHKQPKELTIHFYDTSAPNLIRSFNIINGYEVCSSDTPLISLMFQNRYNQWSFLSFPKKNYESLRRNSEIAYLKDEGDIRYAIEGRNGWRINSGIVHEDMNHIFEDLLMSQNVYRIGNLNGGSDWTDPNKMERVIVTDRTFSEKTARNNQAFSYTFNIEMSLDTFIV